LQQGYWVYIDRKRKKKTSEEKKQLWGQDLSLNKLLNIDFG
jgi:hypothetical protein